MESYNFVFFGIAGSGKGTQMELLKAYLAKRDGRDLVYAYPGAEYRKMIGSGGFTGTLIKESLKRGELQPDFLTNAIVANILSSELTPNKNLIADGYPRTIAQSHCFEDMMKFYQRKNIKIIYIEVGKEEAMRRNLLRARQDDTKEGIEKRFDEYVNNVVPAMDYFNGKAGYEIYKINGEQSVEDVHQEIIKALGI